MSLFEAIIQPFTPLSCLVCSAEGELLCFTCQTTACPPMTSRCYRCRQRLTDEANQSLCNNCRTYSPLENVWAGTFYGGVAKLLVHKLKFERLSSVSRSMTAVMNSRLPFLSSDLIIVPVPTATKRVRQRGYDQARLLARQLAKLQHCSYQRLLGRLGQTRQVGAQRQQRLEQLQSVFYLYKQAGPKRRLPRRVLLVDDILTTGASLESAARVLKQAGIQHVDAAVFAQKV